MSVKIVIGLSSLLTFGLAGDIELSGSNQLLGATYYTYSLNAKNEKCELMYKNNEKLTDETCISLTNSKGVKIHCTKTKKMCKTEQELNDFVRLTNTNTNFEEGVETADRMDYIEHKVEKRIVQEKKKLENFGVLVNACEDLDTTYETKQCRKNISLSKYEFTGKIFNVLTEREFVLKVADEHFVDIKGNFNIDTVLKIQKSGETISITGILTELGSGIIFHHKATYLED